MPRSADSADVGNEITFVSVPTPSSDKKGLTLQKTRMFPFNSCIEQIVLINNDIRKTQSYKHSRKLLCKIYKTDKIQI